MYDLDSALKRYDIPNEYSENIRVINIKFPRHIAQGWEWHGKILLFTTGHIPQTDRMILHEYFHTQDTKDYSDIPLWQYPKKIWMKEAYAEESALERILEYGIKHREEGSLEYFDHEIERIENARSCRSMNPFDYWNLLALRYLNLTDLKSKRAEID